MVLTGVRNKVKIICPIHGEFEQILHDHLNGYGCSYCSGKKNYINDFILQSNLRHNNEYDYSKVILKNYKTKVKIICKEHGEFEQMPSNHVRGNGCPVCNRSWGEFLSFEEARKFIQKLGFKSHKEWQDYCKSGLKPDNIPTNPDSIYGKK